MINNNGKDLPKHFLARYQALEAEAHLAGVDLREYLFPLSVEQDLYKIAFLESPQPKFILDVSTFSIVYLSESLRKLLRLSPEKPYCQQIIETFRGESNLNFLELILGEMRAGSFDHGIHEVVFNENGSEEKLSVSFKSKPLPIKSGEKKELYLIVVTDLSDLIRLNKELEFSQNFLRTIIEINPNPVFVKNVKGHLYLVNKAYSMLTGLGESSKENLSSDSFMTEEDVQQYMENDIRVLEENRMICFEESYTDKLTGETKYLYTYKTPFLIKGEDPKILGVITDITSLKNAEILLRKRERLFREVFDNSADAIFLLNPETFEITDLNRTSLLMFGYEDKFKMIGRNMQEFKVKSLSSDDLYQINKELQGTGFYSFEFEFVKQDGVHFWGNCALRLAELQEGSFLLFRVANIDAQKEYERQIRFSLKEKEVLISEIHHRVKNNMAIISGLLQLQSSYFDDPQMRLAFKESQNRIRGMALIHEMLYQNERVANFEFGLYIKNLIKNIQQTLHPPCPIYIKVSAGLGMLSLNSAIPCGLIINELITNCYKHAFKGRDSGSIEVVFEKNADLVEVAVLDDGIGLNDASTLNEDSLGMTLVYELVRQLKGTVQFEQQGGTCVRVIFKEASE